MTLTDILYGPNEHPDIYKTWEQLVTSYGYSYENHQAITEDGYILKVSRVWKEGKRQPNAKVVFVQHGLFSSADWWVNTAEESLAFQLADRGYDVWVGNNRGTKYSRGHTTWNPNKVSDMDKYFDYSFFELGKFDVPA